MSADFTPHEMNVLEDEGADLQPTIDLGAKQLKRQALDSLFARAMSGILPRSRELKSNEPDTLDERHLHAVLLRAGGMMQKDIAKLMGWNEAWTSVVLNHPDAQYVLTRIVSFAADNVIDMEARIKAHAPEALDVVVEVMRSSNDEKVRSNNAFELLKMAGYGSKKDAGSGGGVNVNVNVNNAVPSSAINNLATALRESQMIEEVTYEILPPAGSVSGSDVGEAPASSGVSGHQGVSEPPTGSSSDAESDKVRVA